MLHHICKYWFNESIVLSFLQDMFHSQQKYLHCKTLCSVKTVLMRDEKTGIMHNLRNLPECL